MNAGEQLLTARLHGFEAPARSRPASAAAGSLLAAYAERTPARRRRVRLPRLSWPVLAALLTALTAARSPSRAPARRRLAAQERAPFAPPQLEDGVVLALGRGVAYP